MFYTELSPLRNAETKTVWIVPIYYRNLRCDRDIARFLIFMWFKFASETWTTTEGKTTKKSQNFTIIRKLYLFSFKIPWEVAHPSRTKKQSNPVLKCQVGVKHQTQVVGLQQHFQIWKTWEVSDEFSILSCEKTLKL